MIDKATWQVVHRGHIGLRESSLRIRGEELQACNCDAEVCYAVDTRSFGLQVRERYECPDGRVPIEADGYRVQQEISSDHVRWRFTEIGRLGRSNVFEIRGAYEPIIGAGLRTAFFVARPTSITNSVVLADLEAGTLRTLLSFPAASHVRVAAAPAGRTLLVGYGWDLLLVDLTSLRIRKYIPEFIDGGFSNNGHGMDRNSIVDLRVEGDRLVAMTFSAGNTTIVPLEMLLK